MKNRCEATTIKGTRCKLSKGSHECFCYMHLKSSVNNEIESVINQNEFVNNEPQNDNCIICMDTIDKKYRLSCAHIFCKTCIGDWVLSNEESNCPICRNHINDTDKLNLKNYMIYKNIWRETTTICYTGDDANGMLDILEVLGIDSKYMVGKYFDNYRWEFIVTRILRNRELYIKYNSLKFIRGTILYKVNELNKDYLSLYKIH
jgi:hypothetical protein